MDKLEHYRKIITQLLTDYVSIPYKYWDLKAQLIISEDHNQFMVILSGWKNRTRVHACTIHLEIIDGKIWVQRDNTEEGISVDLHNAGIPREDIVLGFHPAELRQYTEFAVS